MLNSHLWIETKLLKAKTLIGSLMQSGALLYKTEGLYSVKTTAWMYFILLITWLLATKQDFI